MKSRNYHYHADPATIQRLKEEYEFIGRSVLVPEPDHIVVLAITPRKPKVEKEKADKPKFSRKNTFSASK